MQKIIKIILILLICTFPKENQASNTLKNNKITINVDSTYNGNDTLLFDSTGFSEFKSFFSDSLDYQKEINDIKESVSSKAEKEAPLLFGLSWDKILLLLLSILVIGLIILIYIDKRKQRDEIIRTITGIENSNGGISRLKQWEQIIIEKALDRMNAENRLLYNKLSMIAELKRSIEDIQNRISIIEDQIKAGANGLQNDSQGKEQVLASSTSNQLLYADAIINGVFNKVTENHNDDTVYILYFETGLNKSAKFAIYDKAYRRVLKNADFIDGCEKQRINSSPIDLQVEKGEAQLQDNGKWQITQKAIVKFV